MDYNSSGIYCIASPSGKLYIGQAVNIRNRWSQHRYDLRHRKHPNAALQASYNKYGLEALQFAVVEFCAEANLASRELHHLRQYDWSQVYNIRKTVGLPGRPKGKSLTPEQRARLIAIHTGRVKSADERARIGAAHRGKVVSAETRAKLSAAIKGSRIPRERKDKISAATNSSGARNVRFVRRLNKWSAIVQTQGLRLDLGYYTYMAAAAAARDHCEALIEGIQCPDALQRLAKSLRPPKDAGSSGYKGVSLNKASSKWVAYIGGGRTRKYLGQFSTPEDANQAVLAAFEQQA